MTTTNQLRALAVQALTNTTAAGSRVYSPRDQATWDGEYPVVFVRTDGEDGVSFGRSGAPAFTVTSALVVESRAEHPGELDDAGAAALQVKLEALRDQIKAAVINFPPLMQELNQFSYFRTRITAGPDDAGHHLGAVTVELGLEFVQGPEDFFPVPTNPLEGVDTRIQMPDGTAIPGVDIDLPQ
ncbi:ATP-binding protein [Achromobacter marplatensis]|uniref:ATP-binding protein n=1 Tax=Achromobacter marplatensis TaxID=470868 RepID=A0ABX9G9H8_9BURK|nr:ATP-binding protein [Achromobacter marplatensis]OWT67711.1 ATP-binding protein [Achromobacter marplatensis]RBP19817.1 hypothetical protein DFP87_104153 [Achromobacter marplatensis]CAB3636865.1 hypothetical protein LMG26219_01735 [Achromobacter marplatensis]